MITILLSFVASAADFKPKYGPEAVPLSAKTNTVYFKKNDASDYWTLAPYYIPQETGRGCSTANLSMILNAARVGMKLSSDDELVSFKNLLEKYADESYAKAIKGDIGAGTYFSNRNLAKVLKSAADKLNIGGGNSKAEFYEINQQGLEKAYKDFVSALKVNEKSSNDFIFFSFVQGKVTGDPEGGAHVATIAAYDVKKDLVLVMDPDRKYYEPYWTPSKALFAAIKDPKSDSEQRAGWIHFIVR